jgi:hypothetical protein
MAAIIAAALFETSTGRFVEVGVAARVHDVERDSTCFFPGDVSLVSDE